MKAKSHLESDTYNMMVDAIDNVDRLTLEMINEACNPGKI